MCNFCEAEGCTHDVGGWHNTQCRCSMSGPKKCDECGDTCTPWYIGLQLARGEDLLGYLQEQVFYENTSPISKAELVKKVTDYSAEDADWLFVNLPEGKYTDPGEICLAVSAPIQSPVVESGYGLVWMHSVRRMATGMKLIVKEGEFATMLESETNKPADTFSPGSHILSVSNCSKLASRFRMPAEGFDKMVFEGSPLFVSQKNELQLEFSSVSPSPPHGMGAIRGKAKISVSSPATFTSFFCSLNATETADIGATLRGRINGLVKSIIEQQDINTLKTKKELISKMLSENCALWGLDISVELDYVGEATPEMLSEMRNQMLDFQRNMVQMATQLRQQMQQMPMGRSMQRTPMQGKPTLSAPTPTQGSSSSNQSQVTCAKCGYKNQSSSKFCGNCGSALSPPIKVCPKCGQSSDPSIIFCGNCGAKLS